MLFRAAGRKYPFGCFGSAYQRTCNRVVDFISLEVLFKYVCCKQSVHGLFVDFHEYGDGGGGGGGGRGSLCAVPERLLVSLPVLEL